MSDEKRSSSGTEFDISQIPNEDLEQLAQQIEDHYRKDTTQKQQLSYAWERNHMFIDGRQWLYYDGSAATGGQWKRLEVSRANDFIPRPVTNYLMDIYQTLKSYLIKDRPRSTVHPNTSLYKDKVASKVAELCIEANWARLKEQSNYEYAAACAVLYGTVFKKDYWDTTELMMAKVPKMVQQPKMDPNTGAMTGMEEVQATDPITGDPLFEEMPLGDINSEIIEPFRLAIDPMANDLHKARWVMEYSIQPLAWIKEVYGKEGDGYTGRAEEVQEESQLQGSLRRYYQLKYSSGVKSRVVPLAGSAAGGEQIVNSAVVKEYYERPSRANPNGRLVVVANGITLYSGDSPYVGPELGDWHPYSEFRWEIVPGRFWGKSPLDDTCDIQKQINSIDSAIILTRKTMAIPQKLIPMSAGIPHGQWTGVPGQNVYYRDSTGNKPETIQASGVDPSVFTERAQRVEDMKNISGAIDILKGDRPEGVTAASALELLYEVGTGKIYPVLGRWKNFIESSQKKQLKWIGKFYKEPRKEFINLLKTKNQELSDQAINQFIGSDLYDNCNVVVEAGGNVTKLQAAKKQELREAAQAQVLDLSKPENRIEYLQQMGIAGFDHDVGPDTKRAEWENSLLDNLMNSPDNQPLVLTVDNDDIHIAVHEQRMKEPSWMEQPIQIQQAYMEHNEQHHNAKAQKMQQAAMQAAMAGAPMGQPQGMGMPEPMKSTPKGGPAPTKETKNNLTSDLKVPGGAG